MPIVEIWQTKLPTLVNRTTSIFKNDSLSDMKFFVPVSSAESKSKKVIPASKFVLAIKSPVFFATFYGQMAETKDYSTALHQKKKIYQPSPDVTKILVVFPQIR